MGDSATPLVRVLVVLVIVILAVGCGGEPATETPIPDDVPMITEEITKRFFEYEVVYINGMPCIVFAYKWGEVPSATCNWEMWRGE